MASFMPDTQQELRSTNAALTNAQADNKQLRIQNRQLKAEQARLETRITKLAAEYQRLLDAAATETATDEYRCVDCDQYKRDCLRFDDELICFGCCQKRARLFFAGGA